MPPLENLRKYLGFDNLTLLQQPVVPAAGWLCRLNWAVGQILMGGRLIQAVGLPQQLAGSIYGKEISSGLVMN
ncbi:MAG: hypothetical protein EDM05_029475 [Leptolyngbya sp. IPPAS B-1204]